MRHRSIGWCSTHHKLWYLTRRDAKAIARRHTTHKSAYPCEASDGLWHVGELGLDVIRGEFTRDQIYGRAA